MKQVDLVSEGFQLPIGLTLQEHEQVTQLVCSSF